jgi:hypothetical protein
VWVCSSPTPLTITPEVLSLIARIDEFKGASRSTGTSAPARLQALRHVATMREHRLVDGRAPLVYFSAAPP